MLSLHLCLRQAFWRRKLLTKKNLKEAVAAHPMYKVLEETGCYVTTTVGRSMLPLLRERRDSVKLIPAPDRLKRGDVALYLRPDETTVLHRVLDTPAEGYTMCGDGQHRPEYGVPHEAILGVMEGYWRDERYTPCTARKYRAYTWLWCLSLTLRRVLLWFTTSGKAKS